MDWFLYDRDFRHERVKGQRQKRLFIKCFEAVKYKLKSTQDVNLCLCRIVCSAERIDLINWIQTVY